MCQIIIFAEELQILEKMKIFCKNILAVYLKFFLRISLRDEPQCLNNCRMLHLANHTQRKKNALLK